MKSNRTINKRKELDERLLNHNFSCDDAFISRYRAAKIVAEHYASAENAVSVLSNMPWGTSYICYGRLGEKLGIGNGKEEVESIWEKKVMDCIHPDDVAEKIAWEIQFIAFMHQLPAEKKTDYYLQHFLRMRDNQGHYHTIRHRIFYLDFDASGHILLSLCLYTAVGQNAGLSGIIHSLDDSLVSHSSISIQGLLSARECEILGLISNGKVSKQIANELNISVNTVNNHRQNIMHKLHCQNTAEAIVVAGKLGILPKKWAADDVTT